MRRRPYISQQMRAEVALGGPHTVGNLVPACLRCNRSKGARQAPASGRQFAGKVAGA
jgi:hypothetical protein